MYEWLLTLLTFVSPNVAPSQDYIGVVSAEAAYAAFVPSKKEVTPDKPIDPNCPTCKGVGKIPSGDGQGWTKCPTCQGGTAAISEKIPYNPPAPKATTRITSEVPKPTSR